MDLSKVNALMKKKYGFFYGHEPPPLDRMPTGVLGLDYLMGGGIPKGRHVEISAPESAGKTTTALFIVKTLIQSGHAVAYLDLEKTLTIERVKELGIDSENFLYFRPNSGTDAFEVFSDVAAQGVSLVVIDSVPYLIPPSTLDKDIGAVTMSPQARLISSEQSRLATIAEQTNCSCLFINQLRDKIGGYGGGKVSTGGNALKYLLSIKLEIYAKSVDDKGCKTMTFKVKKNKTASTEGKNTEIDLSVEKGLLPESSWRVILTDLGLMVRAGSYYKFSPEVAEEFNIPEKIGQGSNSVLEYVANNPKIYQLLYDKAIKLLSTK